MKVRLYQQQPQKKPISALEKNGMEEWAKIEALTLAVIVKV